MSFSFLNFSFFINKVPDLSFNQWQQTHQQLQQKQDRLLWGSSLIGSSIFLLGIAWVTFHMPHTQTIALSADTPPAITLDLSTDLAAPPSPPPMAAQPEPQPLEEQSAPLTAPSAPSPDIVLPKIQKVEKIKPIEHKQVTKKQIKTMKQQSVAPVSQTTNTVSSHSQTQPSLNTNSSNANSVNTSSHTKSSMSPATWQGNVLQKLERLKRYPSDAQNERQEGVATIKITINRQGNVLSSKLAKSSGYSLLDKEAIALAYRANPLPAVPEAIKGNSITINVPVEFHLG